MRALVKTKAERGLWMRDVEEPSIGPNDLLVRTRTTGICGTDVHIYNWDPWASRTIPVPLTIGHEGAGEVVDVGSAVAGFKRGDRIAAEGHITCGYCRNCRAGKRHLCRNTVGMGVQRPGCFADLFVIPAANAFRLPEWIDDDVAGYLDPLGNAVHTALSFDLVGEDVLITGAGPIGCMAAAVARFVGARHVVVTDVNDYRLGIALKMGASRAVNVAKEDLKSVIGSLGMTEGFDVGLEMSGNDRAFRQMLEAMNYGGKVALLGIPTAEIPIDWNLVIFKGLVIKGIYGREIFETWYKMANLLKSGLDVKPVLTHKVAAADFEQAFTAMRGGESGKVILSWA
ncbi:MAG: L-threonine 3-dehydrogenase [Clostridia bacterium]|nr:L-threonine 3-dehydrogenase [Deltaproteobacteria bacterium]